MDVNTTATTSVILEMSRLLRRSNMVYLVYDMKFPGRKRIKLSEDNLMARFLSSRLLSLLATISLVYPLCQVYHLW